jgi:hypothetical protein
VTVDAVEGKRLLECALPVLRFLVIRRVMLPRDARGGDSGTGFSPSHLEPQAMRPAPEGLWNLITCAAYLLAGEDDNTGTPFRLDVEGARWWVGPANGPFDSRTHQSLVPREEPCPPDVGLGLFLRGVWYEPDGHLILGDWLEDQGGPSALAGAFRASLRMAPSRPSSETIAYDAFRWRWLERGVMAYFSRRSLIDTDPPRQAGAGFVVGLLHGSAGEVPRRWARWLPEEVGRPLAAEMGVELSEAEEPWVWL